MGRTTLLADQVDGGAGPMATRPRFLKIGPECRHLVYVADRWTASTSNGCPCAAEPENRLVVRHLEARREARLTVPPIGGGRGR
jgi:hypothetical protein